MDWYCKSYIYVRWAGEISSCFKIGSGVRQGGVLSPQLFAVYINDILTKLQKSRLGCIVKGVVMNAFMYADDLILMSASVYDLQRLVNICIDELDLLLLTLNAKKCFCLRVGKRFNQFCRRISIGDCEIDWTDELRYLGVWIRNGNVLKFNLDHAKKKYYRCINSILGKVGCKEDIVLSLYQSYCRPILQYGTEVMSLTITEKKRMSNCTDKLFMKLFKTTNSNLIAQCQYYMSILPVHYNIDLQTLRFLFKIRSVDNLVLQTAYKLTGQKIWNELHALYNISADCGWLKAMWRHFESCRLT
jgi:hypothetical protein